MSKEGNLRWLFGYLRPLRSSVVAGLAAATASGVLICVDPLLMRWLIDVQLPKRSVAGALVAVIAIVACLMGSALLLLRSLYQNFLVEQHLAQQLRLSLLEHLNRMSSDFHENTPAGDNMTRLGADVDQIAQLGAEIASSSVRAVVFFLINASVMLYLNPVMTLAIIPSVLVFSWIQKRFTESMASRADVAQKETGRATSVLYEYLCNMPQLQLLCAEKLIVNKANSVWSGMMNARKSQKRIELAYAASVNAAFLASTLLVLGLGSYEFVRGFLTIGALVAFYTYQTRIFEPVSIATDLYSRSQRIGASIRRIRSVLESKPSVPDLGHISMPRHKIEQGVTFENVFFSYTQGRAALRDVTLSISPHQPIGLVGPSGTGKSTLGRLLVRMQDPNQGEIRLDGYPLREYTLSALRQTVTYVPQKSVLFDGSLRENLLYARPEATKAELHQVLAATQLQQLINQLPEGMDTQLGPNGHSLSGGEMQRVALARALLRNTPILILDESTSALDIPTETAILQSLTQFQTQVLIIISHRLRSLTWMKRIVLLDHGTIRETGSHDSLLMNSPLYRQLFQAESVSLESVLN